MVKLHGEDPHFFEFGALIHSVSERKNIGYKKWGKIRARDPLEKNAVVTTAVAVVTNAVAVATTGAFADGLGASAARLFGTAASDGSAAPLAAVASCKWARALSSSSSRSTVGGGGAPVGGGALAREAFII